MELASDPPRNQRTPSLSSSAAAANAALRVSSIRPDGPVGFGRDFRAEQLVGEQSMNPTLSKLRILPS